MHRDHSHGLNAAPRGSTRDEVVRTARRLIQTRSYLGFSFQDVADVVGVRKPSLYHHFASKEALGTEVLQQARAAFRDWAQTHADLAPAAQLEAYFAMYRNDLHAGERVCPGGSFVPGWDSIEPGLRHLVREIRAEQVQWLTGVLKGLVPGEISANSLASYVYATCQGALITARMTGRVEDFDEVLAQVQHTLFL